MTRKSQVAILLGVGLIAGSLALFGTGAFAQPGNGGGQPADKVVAGGSTLESTGANEEPIPILSQRMRVSSPADLMLHATTECSILTGLVTGEDGTSPSSATSESKVELYITIDGTKVPVSTAGDDAEGSRGDEHKVVFCNREYSRTVTDREGDEEVDEQRDYIRTRSANAFNWFALDTGFAYDDVELNGQNILDVVLWAEFTRTPDSPCSGESGDPFPVATCAEAFVGNRTLIIEPTHAAVNEQVEPAPAD